MRAHKGHATAALEELPRIARGAGVASYTVCSTAQAQAEFSAGQRIGAVPLFLDHPLYPALLRTVTDAPPMLWALGDIDLLRRPSIAIVGARNASSLGRRMARALARGAGQDGRVVVSGLARGIDAESHSASLETGTIAVVAGGVDVIYPRENEDLTHRIRECGLILSEMPPGFRPHARHFPRRNRIVAGLTPGLIVVEAAAKSGSLITARDAADLGREVCAVPGHPFDARAQGCNLLIRDGATLVRGFDDVTASLTDGTHTAALPLATEPPDPPEGSHSIDTDEAPASGTPLNVTECVDTATTLLALLGTAPISEDQLLRDTGLTAPDFAALLTDLELEGRVKRAPGGLLSVADAS